MKRYSDIRTPELEADFDALMAYIDEVKAKQVAEVQAMRPESQAIDCPRQFNEVFIGEDGSLRYDFEIYGTNMSLREWEGRVRGAEVVAPEDC